MIHTKDIDNLLSFFILHSLRIFCDNYGDVQRDFPVRIVHSLVIVFEKNVLRSQREFIHWESLRYVVKRQSNNPWITEKDREEDHEEPQQMRIIHFSRDQHGLQKWQCKIILKFTILRTIINFLHYICDIIHYSQWYS